ncbi:MAG: hypothetical protein GY854_24235, partial [Deltaproteobacteria bacterium]|nr:hypothetical protein [Deltaproteobacteria bacterium]
ASARSRLEAGAPSASEDVGTHYASPTSRLEAGAPSAFRGRGRPVAPVRDSPDCVNGATGGNTASGAVGAASSARPNRLEPESHASFPPSRA